MAIHYGIIADFLNTKNDPAYFDLVTSSGGTNARFTVYQATGNRTATVPLNNQQQFGTSPDLFNLGGSPVALPALVSAESIDSADNPDGANSAAVLRQKKLILSIPRNNNSGNATSFAFPLGDLGFTSGGGSGAFLLVGNPNGFLISVDYQVNAAPQPQVTLDRGVCVALRLETARAIVTMQANGNAIAALAIVGKGQDFAMTLIAPL